MNKDVEVAGWGGDWHRQATFTLVFEITVETAIGSVADVWPNGWVRVKLEEGTIHPLPYQLKVELLKQEGGREYFVIREGRLQGKKASVRLKSAKESYLLKKGKRKGPARLTYEPATETLTIDGLGTYRAVMKENPIPSGSYDSEIPYEPHKGGRDETQYSKYAKTWFRIGHSGDKFLHIGNHSLGCVTVKSHRQWTKIYQHLIQSRLEDRSVGTLTVK